MKLSTKLKELFDKISLKVPRRYLFVGLALALGVSCVAVVLHSQRDNAPRYELASFGSEIDFGNPNIIAHTADDGIAIIGSRLNIEPTVYPRLTSDPSAIWQDEVHTHGGFTLPVQMDGYSIGVLTIPDIGLSVRVYESESSDMMEEMERGVAHFRHTSSWYGNVGASAHNVNFDGSDGYFLHLYRLRPGAVIRYETALGVREYAVETIREICEMDWSMLNRTEDNRITLVTCITGRADLRLAVQAIEILS